MGRRGCAPEMQNVVPSDPAQPDLCSGDKSEGTVWLCSREAFRWSLWLLWAALSSKTGHSSLASWAGALVRKACCAMTTAAVLERWLRASLQLSSCGKSPYSFLSWQHVLWEM